MEVTKRSLMTREVERAEHREILKSVKIILKLWPGQTAKAGQSVWVSTPVWEIRKCSRLLASDWPSSRAVLLTNSVTKATLVCAEDTVQWKPLSKKRTNELTRSFL